MFRSSISTPGWWRIFSSQSRLNDSIWILTDFLLNITLRGLSDEKSVWVLKTLCCWIEDKPLHPKCVGSLRVNISTSDPNTFLVSLVNVNGLVTTWCSTRTRTFVTSMLTLSMLGDSPRSNLNAKGRHADGLAALSLWQPSTPQMTAKQSRWPLAIRIARNQYGTAPTSMKYTKSTFGEKISC